MKYLTRLAVVSVVMTLVAAFYAVSSRGQGRGGPFRHSSQHHAGAKSCSVCHTIPTKNWVAARGFPDVAQFPGHASCFSCHSSNVLVGGKPTFCLNCHTTVAPGRAPLLAFPIKTHQREFDIKFPHNTHQDIYARLFKLDGLAVAHYVNASWVPADDKTQINTCAVCHVQSKAPANPVTPPIKDGLAVVTTPAPDKPQVQPQFFKTMPEGHQTCFSCHYSGVKPESKDCNGCHVSAASHKNNDDLPRYSARFDHTQKDHAGKDCMACHVRIAQSADSRLLKDPDVPINACLQCHNEPFNGKKPSEDNYYKAVIQNELVAREKDKTFQCSYCHTRDIGSYAVPQSHAILRPTPKP